MKDKKNKLPKLSIVIPTLNAVTVLEDCLKSIDEQNYPKDQVEIVVADGGSTDGTQELSEKYGGKVVYNPLKTAEAGKVVGVREASGKYIALIDSDNILPTNDWFTQMIEPLEAYPDVVGSEPWEYTWRKEDGFITRYCALIGMNDPLVHFLGNYDRVNLLTETWTEVEREEEDLGDFLFVRLFPSQLPTIGANGTVFRADFLKKNLKGNYLFDIDILAGYLNKKGYVDFIKVKNGIIHTYCESDVGKFAKKQRRRVQDYLFHKAEGNRQFEWEDSEGDSSKGLFLFMFSTITIFPLIIQVIRGYSRKKDVAWLFHPLACLITLWEYGLGTIKGLVYKSEISRDNWKQ